jgi:saccharopine dehydrogenase (NAD+, L-lysine-forming)
LLSDLRAELEATGKPSPNALVIGALGRVGSGACDLCAAMDVAVTKWDMAETAHGGPFPEILQHDLFFNCILAQEGVPQFVPKSAINAKRALTAIGDIACDPDSSYNPVPVYDRATDWDAPVVRVHDDPLLDVMAIDNLPSMLPVESSVDFADQLLPSLLQLSDPMAPVWMRAEQEFHKYVGEV